MAIQVIAETTASPAVLRLPRRIELDMILSSTEKSEQARFVYSLADDSNIVFDDGSKREEREAEVARAATPITHRVSLMASDTVTKPTKVDLIQDIFDAQGNRTRSRIKLKLEWGQP